MRKYILFFFLTKVKFSWLYNKKSPNSWVNFCACNCSLLPKISLWVGEENEVKNRQYPKGDFIQWPLRIVLYPHLGMLNPRIGQMVGNTNRMHNVVSSFIYMVIYTDTRDRTGGSLFHCVQHKVKF